MNSKKDLKFNLVLGNKAVNPFEGDIETIKGKPGYYCRRIGGFRLKFTVLIDKREIRVLDFGPKGDFKY